MRHKAADQNPYRSYVLWAMGLAVAASGLLTGCSPVEEGQAEGLEQPQSVGRLNKVIERAEVHRRRDDPLTALDRHP